MPELPEVETIRRGLDQYLPGRKISNVQVTAPKLIIRPDFGSFITGPVGQQFSQVRRKGKILLIDLENSSFLVRLGMTGQLHFLEDGSDKFQTLPDKHTHIVISHTDGSALLYRDIRKFGRWFLYSKKDLALSEELNSLGPDPLSKDYTLETLTLSLAHTSRQIKAVLLDQSILCGLGNIYADEVLFASKVRPDRRACDLNSSEVSAIFGNIPLILNKSIQNKGTTFSDYRDANGEKGHNADSLNAYGRYGKPCFVCNSTMCRAQVGGRTTSWCPKCQK